MGFWRPCPSLNGYTSFVNDYFEVPAFNGGVISDTFQPKKKLPLVVSSYIRSNVSNYVI